MLRYLRHTKTWLSNTDTNHIGNNNTSWWVFVLYEIGFVTLLIRLQRDASQLSNRSPEPIIN